MSDEFFNGLPWIVRPQDTVAINKAAWEKVYQAFKIRFALQSAGECETVTVENLGNDIEEMQADISFMKDNKRHFADALADRFGKRYPHGIRIVAEKKETK